MRPTNRGDRNSKLLAGSAVNTPLYHSLTAHCKHADCAVNTLTALLTALHARACEYFIHLKDKFECELSKLVEQLTKSMRIDIQNAWATHRLPASQPACLSHYTQCWMDWMDVWTCNDWQWTNFPYPFLPRLSAGKWKFTDNDNIVFA